MTKFNFKHYFLPTPKRLRILGDSLASASVFAGTFAIINDMERLAVFVIISGWAGKFLTNFFSNEPQQS
jgi:hypothetical protein